MKDMIEMGSLRTILKSQYHAAQLADRLRVAQDTGITWAGAGPRV